MDDSGRSAFRRVRPPRGRRGALAIGTLLVAALVVVVAFAVRHVAGDDPPPAVVRRADPLADLLGWLPADAETGSAVAVWTGGDAPPAGVAWDLGFDPAPLTLGRARGWRERFGYDAVNITGWAVGGRVGGGTVVLAGVFDDGAIAAALHAAGYRETAYRGAQIFVRFAAATPGPSTGGDAPSAANAVGLLDGRVITAADERRVRAAIDAATGRVPSLADAGPIAPLPAAVAPAFGLLVVDAAAHAGRCGGADAWDTGAIAAGSGRAVAVAFGRLGVGGAPRTLVVVGFADEVRATAAAGAFERDWRTGNVATGGAVAPVSVFGDVTIVSRSGALLVAELSGGRVAGWAPAGIRFATAVCRAVEDLAPTATPAGG